MGEGHYNCCIRNGRTVLSKSRVFRAKKLGGDGLAVGNGGFPIKICRQDVCVEFFDVVVQLVTVNEDLRKVMNSVSRTDE